MNRVVITGIGVITPAGNSPDVFFNSVVNGRSAIRLIRQFDTSECRAKIGGEVDLSEFDQWLPAKERSRIDKTSQMAVFASSAALSDAGMSDSEDRERAGVFIGSAGGCMRTVEALHAAHVAGAGPDVLGLPMMMAHSPTAAVAMNFGLLGPSLTISTACSSGAAAIGAAFESVARGASSWAVAGGAEACLTHHQLKLWSSLRALSCCNSEPARAIRPFCRTRDGIALGEGACMVVLERLESAAARCARVYAEISGVGLSSDGFHVTQPSAAGQARAMRRALESADIAANSIDYINAHGTATKHNDKTETEAVKLVMGPDVPPISSIKPITGHMLGASSSAEVAICALAIEHQVVPPTVNYTEPDPDCDLDYVVDGARPIDLKTVITNSFGFGGHNVSMILQRC